MVDGRFFAIYDALFFSSYLKHVITAECFINMCNIRLGIFLSGGGGGEEREKDERRKSSKGAPRKRD